LGTPGITCLSYWERHFGSGKFLLALASTAVLGHESRGTHDRVVLFHDSGSRVTRVPVTASLNGLHTNIVTTHNQLRAREGVVQKYHFSGIHRGKNLYCHFMGYDTVKSGTWVPNVLHFIFIHLIFGRIHLF
jgi:hypothetical protein